MIKSTQIPRLIVCVTIISAILLPITGMTQDQSQDNPLLAIKWIEGPCTADIGDWAIINVPEGYIFCKGDDTRKIMESMGNVPSHEEEGFLADSESDWYIVFEFSEIGYVKDDEKDTLDIDAMLESIKKGTEKSNKYRKERGFPSLTVTGWEVEPHYDEITNNLEWAIRG